MSRYSSARERGRCAQLPVFSPPVFLKAPLSRWIEVVGLLGLCTLISELMHSYVDPANQIMVYLAGVVFIALRHGLSAAMFFVLSSIFLFDLVFVAPRWSLNPIEPQYFFTFGVMFVAGWLVSHLAARARQQALMAESRATRAQMLSELALALAQARTESEVSDALCSAVARGFGARASLWRSDDMGRLRIAAGGGLGDTADATLQAAFDSLRAGHDKPDTGRPSASRTDARISGAAQEPSPPRHLPLRGTKDLLGMLVIEALPVAPAPDEDRDLLRTFASQAAIALERSRFERLSVEATVAKETEVLRNTLLAGISHDFRTPLTTIVGSTTSLLEQGTSLDAEHQRALLTSVLGEAQRMHALMSDLLDLTRLEEGAVKPHFEWCPAEDLVGEVLAQFGPRLDMHVVQTEADPEALVWCDPRLIEQLLANLVDNALRNTPLGGSIRLSVEVRPGGATWVVRDSGPGLPVGREQEMFKKFVRGQSEPAGGGTGLGLAICAAVAKLHGGELTAENRQGAYMVLTLPQPRPAAPLWQETWR